MKIERSHVADCTEHLRYSGKKNMGFMLHLVHAVQELQEDGCEAAALAAGTQVAPLAELVAKGEPLFLQQHLKALQSPVERITQQLH